MGPFYCPNDEKVYIDLDFYEELKNRFNAPGDFAQAYVIAHEIGHHVQKLLGIMDQVEAVRQRMSETQANALQVRVELQADCFAGVWANHAQETKNIIEPGDIDEALNAASAIGDDDRSRSRRKAMSCPTPSPMAPRRSACAGSSAVTRAASSKTAILSTPISFRRNFPRLRLMR